MKLIKKLFLNVFAVLTLCTFSTSVVAQIYPGMEDELDKIVKEADDKLKKAEDKAGPLKKEKKVVANNETKTDSTNSDSTETTKTDSTKTTDSDDKKDDNTNTIDSSNTENKNLKSAVYSDGKATYATSATKFELNSSDQLSQLSFTEYKVDDQEFIKYSTAISIKSEGPHRILYRSRDKAGNQETESVFAVIIDNSAPKVDVASSATYHIKNGVQFAPGQTTIEIKATDSYSGVKKILFSLGSEELKEYKQPVVFDKDGTYTIRYKAIDNLGNESVIKEFKLSIDNKPPTIEIKPSMKLAVVDGKNYSLKQNTFALIAKDDTSGIAKMLVKVDGEKQFRAYSTPIIFSVEGPHTIEAKTIDYVGNESKIVKLEIVSDNNPPKTVIKPVK